MLKIKGVGTNTTNFKRPEDFPYFAFLFSPPCFQCGFSFQVFFPFVSDRSGIYIFDPTLLIRPPVRRLHFHGPTWANYIGVPL